MTNTPGPYSAAVLTISDKGSRGEREDSSGPALVAMLEEQGFKVQATAVVPDEVEEIQEQLVEWADDRAITLILTTGGTGVAPRDRTPEATRRILDREVPGLAEWMRMESLKKTPHAALSRGVCGIRGQSLIINLPGSRRGATENLAVILPALRHAVAKVSGDPSDCGAP